ncbi:DICT sensory domain-containing protein [Halorientalis pallida]|uniref:DICT sensory domain-containing protein n=1 Tax=Halorientalis pallida TaxID=2479928 RepID=UPI003C6F0E34
MTLREIIERVNRSQETLTLLNPDVPPAATGRIRDYLDAQHVRVRTDETDSGTPKNVAILHDDGEFRAASDLRDLAERADVESAMAAEFEDVPTPDVLTAIDDRTFTEFGKRRMIVASREIEKLAYNTGGGNLYSGFQRLSLVKSQHRIYEKLGESAVDVHVFGYPDWDVPESLGVDVYPTETEEIGRTWFVVFDGGASATPEGTGGAGAGGGNDDAKGALLAEEVGENVYSGFWTYRASIVDEIIARLREIST